MEITLLDRINELANKAKTEELTELEQSEQKYLRKEYIAMIRGQVLTTFSNMKIIDPLGNDVTPDKVNALRN